MKRKSKKALLFTALGGSIFSCSFAPSYGMENEMFHAKEEKNQRAICRSFYRNCKNNEEVLFLPCIERKMKQKKQEEFFKFSPHVELPLSQQEDYQTIDFWLSDAEKGNLAALYNVGWLLQQLREKDSFSLMMDEERKNTPPQKEGNSILEKASAFYWLVKANNQEDSEAWYELGMIYARAQSAEKNYEKALEYFQKAAKHNYAAAQRAIGWFYAAGLGVSQDYVEAMKWLQKAAEQNDAWAQYMIGCLYYQGLGVEQDNIEAMKWFYKVPAKLRGDEFSACSFTNKNVRQINLTNLYYSSFEVR